jgi:hypothetical protein
VAYTYTSLIAAKSTTGSIKSWVNYDSIPSTDILTEAQAWIYETLRTREMMVSANLDLDDGASVEALPDDFLDPIALTLDGDAEPLPYVHEMLFNRTRDEDGALPEGRPSRWTIINEQITFDAQLDEAITARFWYYEIPTALSAANETNFLTSRFPTLLRRACMAFAYEFLKRPDEFQTEMVLAAQAVASANMSADRSRRGQMM